MASTRVLSIAALAAVLALAVAGPAVARPPDVIVVPQPPPPMVVETRPHPPGLHAAWIDGHRQQVRGGWAWVPGRWR